MLSAPISLLKRIKTNKIKKRTMETPFYYYILCILADAQKADNKKTAVKKEEKPAVKVKEEPGIEAVDQSQIPADSKTGKAIAYLNAILKNLDCENVAIKAEVRENSALIILEGEGLGVIIGHRGETLDALQHLVSLAANNSGGYFKVTLI